MERMLYPHISLFCPRPFLLETLRVLLQSDMRAMHVLTSALLTASAVCCGSGGKVGQLPSDLGLGLVSVSAFALKSWHFVSEAVGKGD